MRNFLWRWTPLLVWAGFIFYLSANPDPYRWLPQAWRQFLVSTGPVTTSLDELIGEVLHVFVYAVFAWLAMRARVWGRSATAVSGADFVVVVGLSMLYALSDEIHQLFVPGRTFQLADLALDLIGTLIALWVY